MRGPRVLQRALALLLVLLLACAPAPLAGEECKASPPRCCVVCTPPRGALPGEPCFLGFEVSGQCVGSASVIRCAKGRWVQLACPLGTFCQEDAEEGADCR